MLTGNLASLAQVPCPSVGITNTTTPSFFVDGGDWNLDLHACVTSSLTTGPLPPPLTLNSEQLSVSICIRGGGVLDSQIQPTD